MRQIFLACFLSIVCGVLAQQSASVAQTPHTACDHAAGNSSAYIKSNEADDCLDNAANALVTVDFATDANTTITAATFRTGHFFTITSSTALTATRVLTLPSISKMAVFFNTTTGGQLVTIDDGSANDVDVPNGSAVLIHTNGTDVRHIEFAFNNLTTSASADSAADSVAVFDASAAAMREILLDDLGITGGGGGGAAGDNVFSNDWEVIDQVTASAAQDTAIFWTDGIYDEIEVTIWGWSSTTDNIDGQITVSTDGSTFLTGASDYDVVRWSANQSPATGAIDETGPDINVPAMGSLAGEEAYAVFRFSNVSTASIQKQFIGHVASQKQSGDMTTDTYAGGIDGTTSTIVGVNVGMASTNTYDATITVRGRRINPVTGLNPKVGPLLWVRDEKTSGTAGGGSAATSRQVRTLNTVMINEIGGASLSSNQVTLPAGDYYASCAATGYKVGGHQIFLDNTTAASDQIVGTSTESSSTDGITQQARLAGKFSIAAQSVFELEHYTSVAQASDGLGRAIADSAVEVYSECYFWKTDEVQRGSNPDWEVIESVEITSAVDHIDLTWDETLYDEIEVSLIQVGVDENAIGVTYNIFEAGTEITSSIYDGVRTECLAGSSCSDLGSVSAATCQMFTNMGQASSTQDTLYATIRISEPASARDKNIYTFGTFGESSSTSFTNFRGGCHVNSTNTTFDGIRFGTSGGTTPQFSEGFAIVRGRRKSPAVGAQIPVAGAEMEATANTSVTNNGTSTVNYGTCNFETQTGICDTANDDMVVPDGYAYANVTCGLTWDSSVDDDNFRRIQIRKNGTTAVAYGLVNGDDNGQGGAWTYYHTAHTGLIQVSGGDTFECRGTQNSGSTINILSGADTYMRIQLWP